MPIDTDVYITTPNFEHSTIDELVKYINGNSHISPKHASRELLRRARDLEVARDEIVPALVEYDPENLRRDYKKDIVDCLIAIGYEHPSLVPMIAPRLSYGEREKTHDLFSIFIQSRTDIFSPQQILLLCLAARTEAGDGGSIYTKNLKEDIWKGYSLNEVCDEFVEAARKACDLFRGEFVKANYYSEVSKNITYKGCKTDIESTRSLFRIYLS